MLFLIVQMDLPPAQTVLRPYYACMCCNCQNDFETVPLSKHDRILMHEDGMIICRVEHENPFFDIFFV